MTLKYAFFGRHVEIDSAGIFTVVGGGFEAIRATQLPTRMPVLCLLVRAEPSLEERGRPQTVVLEIEDPAGNVVPDPGTPVESTITPAVGDQSTVTHVFTMIGLEFAQAGPYRFRLSVRDGQEFAELTLRVECQPVEGGP